LAKQKTAKTKIRQQQKISQQRKSANKLGKTKISQLQKSAKRSSGKTWKQTWKQTWQDKNQPNTKISQDKLGRNLETNLARHKSVQVYV